MNLVEPLRSKSDDRVLRVILPARISQPTQDSQSNDSQHFDTERWLLQVYTGERRVHRFGEQASGWLADRPYLDEAMDMIKTREWDAVIVGELREVYRNPQFLWKFVQDCVDHDTRFISIADGVDTAEEEWENRMYVATLLAGMAVPEARRRVKCKATFAFHQGGMVLKIRYGYRKLTKEEAASGQFGPKGLRIAKIVECTSYIHGMRLRVLAGDSYPVVADWLNDEGVDPGPYVTGGKWTGRLVRDLLRDPILSGRRQFRKEVSQLIYAKGKNKPKTNPNPPEMQDFVELAHFTPEEHHELLAVMDERKENGAKDQRSGRDSPLFDVPRARSLWPGQHARCAACGGLMYRYGKLLKCQSVLGKGPKDCWNHVLARIDEVHKRVLPIMLQFLDQCGSVKELIAEIAWSECKRLRGAGTDRWPAWTTLLRDWNWRTNT